MQRDPHDAPDPATDDGGWYPRDLIGYGPTPPDPQWPGGARLALSFVVNYEEGGENTVLDGDPGSEIFLNETPGGSPVRGARDIEMESQYAYGSRAGFWRLLRMFGARDLPFTCYAVGLALSRNPEAAKAMVAAGHEIASHGHRWIDYQDVPEDVERAHIAAAVEAIEAASGVRPRGWYTGRVSPRTRRLVMAHGGFDYDCDAYDDDLPYWVKVDDQAQLVIPYTLDHNDMKFCVPPGFTSGDGFFSYLKDAFDTLRAEGGRMMSVGLHCRLSGRPGRAAALGRFLDYVAGFDDVWICTRGAIADHWRATHPA